MNFEVFKWKRFRKSCIRFNEKMDWQLSSTRISKYCSTGANPNSENRIYIYGKRTN